ncbi:hypothetical protein L208DRAFT_1250942, partial [Tricholoma matsutake]
ISYDIACQWFVNLDKCMEDYWPEGLQVSSTVTLRPQIPKLYKPGHHKVGHKQYSFNYALGLGMTDGECPERIWASHNALGNATKTQGPGSQHDVLDDHFGHWNWMKYTGMGVTLMWKYKAGLHECKLVSEWEQMCKEWDEDGYPKQSKSPYHTDGICLSEAQVQKELAEEEGTRLEQGGIAIHSTSASAFLVMGLELEDNQYEASLAEQQNILHTRLQYWEQLRSIYIPWLLQLQADLTAGSPQAIASNIQPEDVELWLPSNLPPERQHATCVEGLLEMENKLRMAQCYDGLEGVQHLLHVKARMVHFKNKNVRGQRDGLCSRVVIDHVHACVRLFAEKYRATRVAKLALVGSGDWEAILQPLKDSDICAYTDPSWMKKGGGRQGTQEDEEMETVVVVDTEGQGEGSIDLLPNVQRDGTGETRCTLSWIWTTMPVNLADGQNDDILRSEWAKSRARAAQATEEVILLREEMHHVLVFLPWKAGWWLQQAECRSVSDLSLLEGLQAYAMQQSYVQTLLATHFHCIWKSPLEDVMESTQEDDEHNNDDDLEGNDEDDGGDNNGDDDSSGAGMGGEDNSGDEQ